MIRIAKSKEGEVSIDPSGKKPGRGAYVALEPAEVEAAWEKRILDRTLDVELSDEFYQELLDYVKHQKPEKSSSAMNKQKALNMLGLAMCRQTDHRRRIDNQRNS